LYQVSDYYRSDKIEMTGLSTSKDNLIREGEFVYYYENGNKKSSTYYKDAEANGKYFEWYKNGYPKIAGEYITDAENPKTPILKILEYWDANSVLKITGGNGDYSETTANETSSGKMKDGFKDGLWTGSSKKYKFTFSDTYINGKFVSGTSTDSDKEEHPYTAIEVKAEPPKGINDFRDYVGNNFQLPAKQRSGGRIISKFVVEKNGKLDGFKILQSIGSASDSEMIRVIKSYPDRWNPGMLRGIKMRMQYSMPLSIEVH
ncbi:MAG TPA: hypothetical protein VK476_03250, partial [Flavobacterium sp.]|nr:hypothetical protein [Flavobacterium sp.]